MTVLESEEIRDNGESSTCSGVDELKWQCPGELELLQGTVAELFGSVRLERKGWRSADRNFPRVNRKRCYQVYRKLALTEEAQKDLNAIVEALNKYFVPKRSVTYESFIFNTCQRENGESIDAYVNRLRGLSATCEFGDLTDSLIRDRVVLGTKHSSIRSRFLTEENLTLEKSIAIGRSYEQAQKQAIDNNEPEEAYRIQRKPRETRYQAPRWKSNDKQRNLCGRNHERNKRKCPAYEAECHTCHKTNHFARMCKNRPKNRRVHAIEERESGSEQESTYKIEQVYTISNKQKWYVSLNVAYQAKKQSRCDANWIADQHVTQ